MIERLTNWMKKLIGKTLQLRIVVVFSKKFPRLYRFILDRFDKEKFSGLPLSILALLFFCNLFLLSEITEKIINSDKVVFIDHFFANSFYQIRLEWLVNLFYVITLFVHPYVISVLSIGLSVYFLLRKKLLFMLCLLVSLAGSSLTMLLGKHLYHLERPNHFAWYQESTYTFPSGHATIAVAFYGLLFYLGIHKTIGLKKRGWFFLSGVLFIGLIGLSRLYLVVHFVSDVLAGYFLGSLWLLFSISILEWKNYNIRS